jgi:hypothetical protein
MKLNHEDTKNSKEEVLWHVHSPRAIPLSVLFALFVLFAPPATCNFPRPPWRATEPTAGAPYCYAATGILTLNVVPDPTLLST